MTSPQDASSSSPNPYESVIGILTHPRTLNGEIKPDSIIRKSYVKFVKSAGARAIPLIYNEDPNELRKKLDLVNGVLLTGGRAINHGKDVKTEKEVVVEKYAETVRSIFEYVKKRNGEGKDYFPLYGICLGFELITKIVSEDDDILENFDADDYASNLDFAKEEALKGSIFERYIISTILFRIRCGGR
ncbi:Gamma-glutamyl hydrolase, partial [Stylosanthes scabra]|nr:Gamma-glutamyl hydrolase [Stylosanthes scabra]